jgi:pyruvate formate lyase activating enzyme
MNSCLICRNKPAAASFAICADCIRAYPHREKLIELHAKARERFGLPARPPATEEGIACRLCANGCRMGAGESGYCGIRYNAEGRLVERSNRDVGLAHTYLDRLPTNCCASWFCEGCREEGYNLAVFLYGCSFDCLYCQNAEHKTVTKAPSLSCNELVDRALDPKVRCVCYFGGSPEPQFHYVLESARRILEKSGGGKHVCFEWNGSGNWEYVEEAMILAHRSGGTVKYDLKAFDPNLHAALCGVENEATLRSFERAAGMFPGHDVLTATTLLVPFYVDEGEVEKIALFIAHNNPDIPYSLLVFHPDLYLEDLPITPREQVFACYDAAKQHVHRVHIGNRGLL